MKYTRKNIYCRLRAQIFFSRRLLLCSMVLTLCITAISAVSPFLYKILVDDVMTKGRIKLLSVIIPAMLAVYIVKVVFSALNTFVNKKFANLTGLEVKRQLMQRFLCRAIERCAEEDVGRQKSGAGFRKCVWISVRACGRLYHFVYDYSDLFCADAAYQCLAWSDFHCTCSCYDFFFRENR